MTAKHKATNIHLPTHIRLKEAIVGLADKVQGVKGNWYSIPYFFHVEEDGKIVAHHEDSLPKEIKSKLYNQ